MADDADRAAELIELEAAERNRVLADRLEQGMEAHRREQVNRMCIECEQPIEPERWKALRGCTSRCSACAHDYERRVRAGRC